MLVIGLILQPMSLWMKQRLLLGDIDRLATNMSSIEEQETAVTLVGVGV